MTSPGRAGELPVLTIDRAELVRLEPVGGPAVQQTAADLRRRWDLDFPGHDGHAVYRVALPPHAGDEAMALLFSRVGNQVQVSVNGRQLQRWGRLGDPTYDAGKVARMVVIPAQLLRGDRPDELTVEVTVQQQRWGGLSTFRYGTLEAVEPLFLEQQRWRHSAVLVFACSLVGMALSSAALGWRQRDPSYRWFSLAALFGTVRDVDRLWPDPWLPWPFWGAFEAGCYATHIALIVRFLLLAIGGTNGSVDRAIDLTIVATTVLAIVGFLGGWPMLWTLALGLLIPLGLAATVLVIRAALQRRTLATVPLIMAGVATISAGIHDYVRIRLAPSDGFVLQWTPPAMFGIVVVLAGIVVHRYNRSVNDHRELAASWSEQLAERELEIRRGFEALRRVELQASVADERRRIMQELHDGVGSQLVGLLQLVRQPRTDRDALAEHVTQALDEMRMVVDAAQPAQDDLVSVLATLRFRLAPRLEAAGVRVVWRVSDLPSLLPLSPDAALQVQRLLLEAFTNILKHARAGEVIVESFVRAEPAAVVLRILDDGVGFFGGAPDTPPAGGRGLDGMRRRAGRLGATLRFGSSPAGGVAVSLEWPLPSG